MNEKIETPPAVFTPQQQLAKSIVAELVAKGLVTEDKQSLVETKLATGAMKSGDWRTEIARTIHEQNQPKGGPQ